MYYGVKDIILNKKDNDGIFLGSTLGNMIMNDLSKVVSLPSDIKRFGAVKDNLSDVDYLKSVNNLFGNRPEYIINEYVKENIGTAYKGKIFTNLVAKNNENVYKEISLYYIADRPLKERVYNYGELINLIKECNVVFTFDYKVCSAVEGKYIANEKDYSKVLDKNYHNFVNFMNNESVSKDVKDLMKYGASLLHFNVDNTRSYKSIKNLSFGHQYDNVGESIEGNYYPKYVEALRKVLNEKDVQDIKKEYISSMISDDICL